MAVWLLWINGVASSLTLLSVGDLAKQAPAAVGSALSRLVRLWGMSHAWLRVHAEVAVGVVDVTGSVRGLAGVAGVDTRLRMF